MPTIIRPRDFTAERAWGALDIAQLDGRVEMHWREAGEEHRCLLEPGDVFFAEVGCEHVTHPQGPARILVVERAGSV